MQCTLEPGVYSPAQLLNSDYHNGGLVTKSKLDLVDRSPNHLKHALDNPREETKALRVGKALHCAVLEPEVFLTEYFREFDPTDYPKALRNKSEIQAVVEEYNATLPPLLGNDELKQLIVSYNDALPKPIKLNQGAEKIRQDLALILGSEPDPTLDAKEIKSLADDYNNKLAQSVMPTPRNREALLDIVGQFNHELFTSELAKPAPIDPNATIAEIMAKLAVVRPDVLIIDQIKGEYYASNTGKIMLPIAEYDDILNMTKAVQSHPSARVLLSGGIAEYSLIHRIEAGTNIAPGFPALPIPVTVGMRPDYWKRSTDKGNFIVDLKTTEDARPEAFQREMEKYRYDVQAAFYTDMHVAAVGPVRGFVFIAVEKKAPHAIRVYYASPNMIRIGRHKYQRNLQLITECIQSGNWPSYPVTVDAISLPEWAERRAQDAGWLE
jgi:hypothetical protein